MPYAKLAAFRLQMMEDNLHLISDPKAKEKYIKETEKALKEEFIETMKNFSRSQGLLLLKLIHRETGKTTYEILKGYRGSVETFYWGAFAKMYNASLKVEYDPILDYQLDMIIKAQNLE
jgi:ABC-type transporter MlaC component